MLVKFFRIVIFHLVIVFSITACFYDDGYEWLEQSIITEPYLSEKITLGESFDLYITKGASITLKHNKQSIQIKLNDMTIMCVQEHKQCIGQQYVFNFSANNNETSTTFQLIMNEPQNMALLENDIEETLQNEIFGYTITLLDLNFSINKNSISLLVTKEE